MKQTSCSQSVVSVFHFSGLSDSLEKTRPERSRVPLSWCLALSVSGWLGKAVRIDQAHRNIFPQRYLSLQWFVALGFPETQILFIMFIFNLMALSGFSSLSLPRCFDCSAKQLLHLHGGWDEIWTHSGVLFLPTCLDVIAQSCFFLLQTSAGSAVIFLRPEHQCWTWDILEGSRATYRCAPLYSLALSRYLWHSILFFSLLLSWIFLCENSSYTLRSVSCMVVLDLESLISEAGLFSPLAVTHSPFYTIRWPCFVRSLCSSSCLLLPAWMPYQPHHALTTLADHWKPKQTVSPGSPYPQACWGLWGYQAGFRHAISLKRLGCLFCP